MLTLCWYSHSSDPSPARHGVRWGGMDPEGGVMMKKFYNFNITLDVPESSTVTIFVFSHFTMVIYQHTSELSLVIYRLLLE